MIEAPKRPLRVELLNASHLSKIPLRKRATYLPLLQLMLVRSFLAQAEEKLHQLISKRQPKCLVAFEDQNLIAFCLIEPYNLRGTCWTISPPDVIDEESDISHKNISYALIHKALSYKNNSANSWIIKCSTNQLEQLAASRELGFQPLKLFNSWSLPTKANKLNESIKKHILPSGLEWQRITRSNANLLWPLEKSQGSVHLRQILDRQLNDLVNHNKYGEGVLLSTKENSKVAIAGLINRSNLQNRIVLEMLTDTTWDIRVGDAIPFIINEMYKLNKSVSIETSSRDEELTESIAQFGCIRNEEQILLGRSLWRRQTSGKLIQGAKSLESMLEGLKPQQPPLPTPSLGRR